MANKLNKSLSVVATSMVIVGGSSVLVHAVPINTATPKLEVKSILKNKANLTELGNIKSKENKTNANKIKNGVYSIKFKVYHSEKNEESMMNNFLDEKAKLEVKDGKLTLTMVFKIFADQIYDFCIESNGICPKSIVTNYGDFNKKTKKYQYKKFQLNISDIDSIHKGYVLVGAMGGLTSDIGDLKKYREAKFIFDKNSLKDWTSFNIDKKVPFDYDKELNKKLVNAKLDKNNDGIVSDEELKSAKGKFKITSLNSKDFTKIKFLGKDVEELTLFGENIDEIPTDTFDNLINLKKLDLRVDLLKLPKGIFKNLKNLEDLTLMSNNISKLPKGVFNDLINLKYLSLEKNPLEKLDSNVFNNLKNLESLSLKSTKLKEVPKGLYNLHKLKILNLEDNELKDLSKGLGSLKNLNTLYLGLNCLEEIPYELYNLKNLNNFYIENNLIKKVPKNLFKLLPNSKNVFYSYNKIKLDDMPKEPTDKFIMSYPQNIMNLNLIAKDGKISWKQEFSALDVLCWRKFSVMKNKPKNIEEYKSCLNGKMPLEVVKNNFWRPIIETTIQKKNKNGEYFNIKKIVNDNEIEHSDIYNDSNMKNEDEYRIIKKVSIEEFGSVDFIFKDIVYAKAKMNIKKPILSNKETNNNELLNNNTLKELSNQSELLEKPILNNKENIISNKETDNNELLNNNTLKELSNQNGLLEKPILNNKENIISNKEIDNNELLNDNKIENQESKNKLLSRNVENKINEEHKDINNLNSNKNVKNILPRTGSPIGNSILVSISSILAILGLFLKRKN